MRFTYAAASVGARLGLLMMAGLLLTACGSGGGKQETSVTLVGLRADVVAFRPVLAVCPVLSPDDTAFGSACGIGVPGGTAVTDGDVVAQRDVDGSAIAYYVLGPVLVDGSSLETARVGRMHDWTVEIVFREGADGIDRFNAVATECFQKTAAACPTGQLAIVRDDEVISAPAIQQQVFERDQIQISGSFDEATATALVDHLLSR
jgi:hypothetical protein